jgi:uncharacterized membrane protein YiaA
VRSPDTARFIACDQIAGVAIWQSSFFLKQENAMHQPSSARPSNAFVGASWGALIVGMIAFLIGLSNAQMQLNEKGYYFTILLYGSFAAVSLQKTLRDRAEGQQVTGMYVGMCWISLVLSEKGFYGMSFVLVLFAIVAVQKNVRDLAAHPAS